MTAQISDTVIFRGEPYSLASVSGEGLFVPQDHGLHPVAISTACYRGTICTYEVRENSLRLQELVLRLPSGEGNKLFGRLPEASGYDLVYEDLDELMPFTGGMLIGRDFIRELYVHMGFHPAYKFRKVFELLFEKGRMVESRDRSAYMAQFREKVAGLPLEPTDPKDIDAVKKWIESTFSLDYGAQLQGIELASLGSARDEFQTEAAGTDDDKSASGTSPPPCPYCGSPLRTAKARLCLECGREWYHLEPGELPEPESDNA